MGDLSDNFSTYELACKGNKCCGNTCSIDRQLIRALESFRRVVDCPIYINSGFRCNAYNSRIRGSKNSKHTKGLAADIRLIDGYTVDSMAQIAGGIPSIASGGIGLYDWGIHVDVSKQRRRWDERL